MLMWAGLSNSGPNLRVSPLSKTSEAHETAAFLDDEAAVAGISGSDAAALDGCGDMDAVSYTHLTLPTM